MVSDEDIERAFHEKPYGRKFPYARGKLVNTQHSSTQVRYVSSILLLILRMGILTPLLI